MLQLSPHAFFVLCCFIPQNERTLLPLLLYQGTEKPVKGFQQLVSFSFWFRALMTTVAFSLSTAVLPPLLLLSGTPSSCHLGVAC